MREMMANTDLFSQAMTQGVSGAVDDLTAQVEGSSQAGSTGAQGRGESDIAEIMKRDTSGRSNGGNSGGTSRGGTF